MEALVLCGGGNKEDPWDIGCCCAGDNDFHEFFMKPRAWVARINIWKRKEGLASYLPSPS